MCKFVRTEKKILWVAVQEEVQRRSGKLQALNYLQNIYRGRQTSAKIKVLLDEIIDNKKPSDSADAKK